MPRQMTDYGEMMGLSDLGPQPEDFSEEELGAALFGREQFTDHPELHQDYAGDNPYGEGAHGSWQEGQGSFYAGMGAMDDTDANAGLEIPIDEGDDDMDALDEESEALIDEEIEMADDSAEYQAR